MGLELGLFGIPVVLFFGRGGNNGVDPSCHEAHCTALKSTNNNRARNDRAALQDNGGVRIRRRLFQTATPRLASLGSKHDDDEKLDVVSMGNEEIYGKQVFMCDMLKAIELGLITDNRLHVVCVKGDEDNLKKLAASKEVEDVEGTPFDVALACALKQVLGELGKAFAFHTFIRESRKTADILRAVLPKSARVEYVDSKRSNKENKEALDNFGQA